MDRLNDVATLLVASCAAASDDNLLPADTEILSTALRLMRDEGVFPDWFRKELHFSDTGLGTVCIELPTLLRRAQDLELTSVPNPSYTKVKLEITRHGAPYLLGLLGEDEIDFAKAKEWGKKFRAAVAEALSKRDVFEKARAAGS